MRERVSRELERLHHGYSEGLPEGLGIVRFDVETGSTSAADVVEKVTAVLEIVDQRALLGWPSLDEWRSLLPVWFTGACAPEMTVAEAEAWLTRWEKLDDAQRRAEERGKRWSLENWLYWMEPEKRSWWWWNSVQADGCQVFVQVDEWPFPWGSLAWLLRAAGATDVEPEE